MVFGRKKKKIEFDARKGLPDEIKSNPNDWEYIHNFKVHYKASRVQVIATKQDISIPSKTATLPSLTEVTEIANAKIQAQLVAAHHGIESFHITNIEYKESIAFLVGQSGW